jgi:tRNA(Ile)-lysidine synthase
MAKPTDGPNPGAGLNEVFYRALTEAGVNEEDGLVVGVSGGRDSMVLADLVSRSAWRTRALLAHAHFGLRGADSDADAELVQVQGQIWGLRVTVAHLDARGLAEASGNGLQAAARELRYEWWRALANEEENQGGRVWILTAHHAGDQLETIWIQWLRGGEEEAARGIPARRGNILRPLLACAPERLAAYAREMGVPFREDVSNRSPKYLRNRVRHELIPLVEALRPGVGRRMIEAAGRRAGGERAGSAERGEAPAATRPLPSGKGGAEEEAELFRWAQAWGARRNARAEVLRWAHGSAGQAIRTPQALLWRERTHLAAVPHAPTPPAPPTLLWEMLTPSEHPSPHDLRHAGPHVCHLDLDRLAQPLHSRPWQPGDRMQPFGMTGHQKISDLLNQHQHPSRDRNHAHVLVDAQGTLLWLIGYRTATAGSLLPSSKHILRLTLVPPSHD